MGISLHDVRKVIEHVTKSKINEKLKKYLEKYYPKEHQQINAHEMSLNARALVGVLFTLGLLSGEIEHIVGDSGKMMRKRV